MPIAGTQTVIAPIAPTATTDSYPTHEDAYGKGGFVSIATAGSGTATDAQINAKVVADRRKTGMLVYDTSTAKYYRCTNGGSGNWVHENFGAGQGTVQSVALSMPTGRVELLLEDVEKLVRADPLAVVLDERHERIGHERRNHRDVAEQLLDPRQVQLDRMLADVVELIGGGPLAEPCRETLLQRFIGADRAERGIEAPGGHHHAVADPEVVGAQDHHAVGPLGSDQSAIGRGIDRPSAAVVQMRRDDPDDRGAEFRVLGLLEPRGDLRSAGFRILTEAERGPLGQAAVGVDPIAKFALESRGRRAPKQADLVKGVQERQDLLPLRPDASGDLVEGLLALESLKKAQSLRRDVHGPVGEPEGVLQDDSGLLALLDSDRNEPPDVGAGEMFGKFGRVHGGGV